MEFLILGLVALAFVLTFCVIALKILWLGAKVLFGLLVLPLKLLSALLGGAVELAVVPLKLGAFLIVLLAIAAGIVLIPILVPVLVILGLVLVLAGGSAC